VKKHRNALLPSWVARHRTDDEKRAAGIKADEKRKRQAPGAITLSDLLDYEHKRGGRAEGVAGTGLSSSFTVFEDGDSSEATGMDDDVYKSCG